MIAKFDDSSLDATRRSIFLYSILSLALFEYRPQDIDLKELFFDKIGFGGATLTPEAIGLSLTAALLYLLVRLLIWLPLHQEAREKRYAEEREELDKDFAELRRVADSCRGNLNRFQDYYANLDLEPLERAYQRYSKDLPKYEDYAHTVEEFRGTIEDIIDDAHKKSRSNYSEHPENLFLDRLTQNFHRIAKKFESDLVQINKKHLHTFETTPEETKTKESEGEPSRNVIERVRRSSRQIVEDLNESIWKLERKAEHLRTEDRNAYEASRTEVQLFGIIFPLGVVTGGLAAAACVANGATTGRALILALFLAGIAVAGSYQAAQLALRK